MKNLSLEYFNDAALLPVALLCFLFSTVIWIYFYFIKDKTMQEEEKKDVPVLSFVHSTKPYPSYRKKDIRNIIWITGIYAIISFYQLGSLKFPVTTWQPSKTGQDIVFELKTDTNFDAIYTIYGEGDNNSNPDTYQLGTEGIQIYGSNDHHSWDLITTLKKGSIYQYQIIEGNWKYKYVWLRSTNKNNSLTEIGLRSSSHTSFVPLSIEMDGQKDSQYPATLLIDEQDKLVLHPTYYDQSYFDEIYHPRNAWEIANGQDMYATVHPLFGTNTMALFIKLFGMSPFVWRLPGALFGIFMIPLMYGIARRLFYKTSIATIASILLAFDFMHLTTSRIGTLEPFSIFWIMVMFYYMIRYIQMSWYDTTFFKQLKYLSLCGITMGIAIATKWTACYSAVGLAILLFTYFFIQYSDYQKAKKHLKNAHLVPSEEALAIHIKDVFPKCFAITIGLCFIFFIFIPIIIYAISYIPDRVWKNDGWSFMNVWKQCEYMFQYHSSLNATHPYSSTWKQWLLDLRPIWYYNGYDVNNSQHTISCFSNPLMTWLSLGGIVFTVLDGIRTKKQSALVIVIGYITALAPWMIITRCVFAYHFYPTSIFAILSIAYLFSYLWEYGIAGKSVVCFYIVMYILLFVVFLPATAGFATTNAYIKSLEWFSTWYFG